MAAGLSLVAQVAQQEEITPMTDSPRFPIGTTYKTRGKHSRLCTVTDILRTYNAAGDLVRIRYVTTHEFAGQIVTDSDVTDTTVAMGVAQLA
jgi:hypothetical protein